MPPISSATTPASRAYDASSIEVLEGLEPVRKRPGMYIGGTDEHALHHLVAEILDNSMDEAVAGHANRIEVELHADGSLTIRDNGRGMPVDPHPKFPGKSALEVIHCTLHAGGKFSGKAYETSGGLHGVGASVVNALSDWLVVQVARNKELYRAAVLARASRWGRSRRWARRRTGGGPRPPSTRTPRSSAPRRLRPARLLKMVRSKAYLFSGVEIRWRSDGIAEGDVRPEAALPLSRRPRRLPGREAGQGADLRREALRRDGGVPREVRRCPRQGRVGDQLDARARRLPPAYCNTIPTPEGGTHEAGFWAAILKGLKAYGELAKNRKAADITREDLLTGGCALVSCFIREPEFVGQTKDRLATQDAARLVEGAVRDHFDHWLAANNKTAGAILDFLVLRAEERLRRRPRRRRRARPPPRSCGCRASSRTARPRRARGRSCSSSRATRRAARPRWRGTGETQALLPLRGKILNVLGAASAKLGRTRSSRTSARRWACRPGSKFNVDDLRYEKVIIMTDADVDGAHIASLLMTFFFTQMRPLIDRGHLYLACPPLYRLTQGAKRLYVRDDAEKDEVAGQGPGREGQDRRAALQGPGRDGRQGPQGHDHGPGDAAADPGVARRRRAGETGDLVERLMGKRPEMRFQYIQENARFVEELDV